MAHPPIPRLAIRVATDGPSSEPVDPTLEPELRASVRKVLALVQRAARDIQTDTPGAYNDEPPLLSIVSPLAGSAARIVAEEGLSLGFALLGVLPCRRADYESHLAAGGAAGALALLDRAETCIELDGALATPAEEASAHQAAAELALKHCELLIAVYHQHSPRAHDPSAALADTALGMGIPVVWIDAAAPQQARLLLNDLAGRRQELGLSHLEDPLRSLLLPPEKAETDEQEPQASLARLQMYYGERQRRLTVVGWAWSVFFALLGDRRLTAPRFRVPNFITTTRAEWRQEWHASSALPSEVIERVEQSLLHAYAWADKLAIFYANAYRSTYLLSYLLGVFGVLCELAADTGVPFAGGSAATPRAILQIAAFCCLLAIVVIWWAGRHGRWHERWIDYRLLAELLRQLRFLSLLGQVPVFSRLPAHEAYDNPRNTWINWYLRALARAAGIMPVQFSESYLEAVRTLYRTGLLEDQQRYHRRNAIRHRRVDVVLRRAGLLAFALTFALLALLVIGTIARLTAARSAPEWLIALADAGATRVFAVWLPIAGGAIAAIRTQAELERVAKRSHAMSRQLETLANSLTQQEPRLSSAGLTSVAEGAAQTMLSEVLDWRIVFQEKPLELSG